MLPSIVRIDQMTLRRLTFITALSIVAMIVAPLRSNADTAVAPASAPTSSTSTSTTSTSTTSTSTTTTSTTTTVPLSFAPNCPQWIETARAVGWPEEQLETLDKIIMRESTCRAEAHNDSDPGSIGSIGLTQVNSAGWCDPNRYWPNGFMQEQGIGLSSCHNLFDPVINLQAALVIWKRQGGFGAWGM